MMRSLLHPPARLWPLLLLLFLATAPAAAQEPDGQQFQDPYEVRDELEDIFSSPEFRRLKYERSEKEITDSDYEPPELPDWLKGPVEAIGSILAPALSIGFWIVLAVICAAIVYVIYTAIAGARREVKQEGWLPDEFEEGDGPQSPAEFGADVYLNRAAELAAEGRTRDAIAQLLLGAMSFIEREGLIRFRRGLTSRDYLRAVRSNEALYTAFKEIVRIYEPICFGRREAQREHYESSLAGYLGAFHAP